MNIMWRLILACLFTFVLHISTAFSPFTFIDKYLKGAQLKVVQVEDWYECIKQCQEDPLCISYNFDNKSECQINIHGVEERCQAEDELTSRAGWIYHQIREVQKKTGRRRKAGSCPCNCGASKQCRVEPEYGDVLDKAGRSCEDILEIRRNRGPVPNGAYYLQSVPKPVYCHMTAIPECGNEGGWSLVMKINGSKKTFSYNSKHWITAEEYQPENGANLDEKETKLNTFSTIPFLNICLGMKQSNSSSIQWLTKERSSGKSMISLIMSPENHWTFGYPKEKWLNLLPGSKLDAGEKKDGFNVEPARKDGARVRIGVIAHPTQDNGDPISYIGFGAGGDASAMYSDLTCGNVNGKTYLPAFGYILVK